MKRETFNKIAAVAVQVSTHFKIEDGKHGVTIEFFARDGETQIVDGGRRLIEAPEITLGAVVLSDEIIEARSEDDLRDMLLAYAK